MPIDQIRVFRQVQTSDGNINIIIDDRWAALFPKETADQITFLVEHANRAISKIKGD